ncbi:Calx-beta domain-containing protein [Oceaniovalibus sp. ACAM 378]|uniref:Calx-beta domain-containing protein n=1 Tax=Oceaniovalibus sp. ACAM 378 TaxID=2599923 RepID=UPI0011D98FAA|nr:Calx-beta domain-containing protein [Oceaniovalibus sp. ACAM 378]TYB89197.1 hypothetical protein FQ320_09805 [Oceaniovalibus sp. ACAM 378]
MPVISVDPISGPETGAGQIITIRLDQPATQAVTVDLQLRGQTAIPQNDVDFNAGAGVWQVQTVTIPVGQTSVTTFVVHNGRVGDEVDENYVVELTNPVNATLNGGVDVLQVTGVIEDDGRSLFVSDPTILEGDNGTTEAVFEIRISEPASVEMQFSYATQDGTATAGSDYSARSGNVTFAPGQTVVYVRVPVSGDILSEASETFSLVVSPIGGAANLVFNGVADNVGTALIRDDDGTGGQPVITLETTNGIESSSGQFHIIRLSEASTRDISVTVQILSGTAYPQNDVDFNSGAGVWQVLTVTIPAGDTSATFPVFQNGSASNEVDENYVLELTDPVNATLAGGGDVLRETAVILDTGRGLFVSDPTILEGDSGRSMAVFEIRVSQPHDGPMTFSYATIDGLAQQGEDYLARSGSITFAAGQTVAYVHVPVNGDRISEASETFSLVVTPTGSTANLIFNGISDNVGTALIRDDDGQNGLPVITIEPNITGIESSAGQPILIRLSEASVRDVTVTLTLKNQAAETSSDVDFNFGAGVQTQVTVTIPAGEVSVTQFVSHNGSPNGENDENYVIEATNPQNAVLAGGVDALSVSGVILDGGRSLFVSDPRVSEGPGGAEAIFEIQVSRPSEVPLSFNFITFDGTAQAGTDYQAMQGSVTLVPGQTLAYVRVPLINDSVIESAETFGLSLNAAPATAAQIPGLYLDNVGTATILNDDFAGRVIEGGNGRDTILGHEGNDTIFGFGGFDSIDGGEGDDSIQGGVGNDTILGGDGDDYINGGLGFDLLNGGDGDDYITGLSGYDTLNGGIGDDTLLGNNGFDLLNGGAGNDDLRGGLANDTLNGGDGNDLLAGEAGNDRLSGDAGNDTLSGNAGADDLSGGVGNDLLGGGINNDTLSGGGGHDTLNGDNGSDLLLGEGGNDVLNGNAGFDTLDGGAGNDLMRGGIGIDVFIFGEGQDTISDFANDFDTIRLDDALWGGQSLSIQQILDFADPFEGGVLFDFGGGNTLQVNNIGLVASLANDIEVF